MYKKGSLNSGIKKELNEFVETYTEILNQYYQDVSENELLESGVKGMINYLGDPYSVYMNEEASIAFNEKISGEYGGIGTEVIQYENLKLEFAKINEDGPAEKAGLKVGDVLIKVDDKDVKEMYLADISKLVRGKVGTKVKITVLRDNKEINFEVKRESIDLDSVNSKIMEYNNHKIGYIGIDIFAANTNKQFESNLKKLEKEGIDSLVIDVRGNSGGYLSVVTDILSIFNKKGKLIYQLKTKGQTEKVYDKTEEKREYKVAILVNGGSASASEVLTSTMKDVYGAYTIGTNTYGKSKVQKTQELKNGAMIKFTYQEWLTVNGEMVGEDGIVPEYEVQFKPSSTDNLYDSQLQKALDLLVE